MNRRDVVLARVFFSDSPESKVRPAIVLSDEEYNSSGFALLSSVTTASDEYCLQISERDANCQFAKNSGARFDGIIKLPCREILKTIGKVTPEFHGKLVERIISTIRK